jgi:hypothetical protein
VFGEGEEIQELSCSPSICSGTALSDSPLPVVSVCRIRKTRKFQFQKSKYYR